MPFRQQLAVIAASVQAGNLSGSHIVIDSTGMTFYRADGTTVMLSLTELNGLQIFAGNGVQEFQAGGSGNRILPRGVLNRAELAGADTGTVSAALTDATGLAANFVVPDIDGRSQWVETRFTGALTSTVDGDTARARIAFDPGTGFVTKMTSGTWTCSPSSLSERFHISWLELLAPGIYDVKMQRERISGTGTIKLTGSAALGVAQLSVWHWGAS